MGCARRPSTSRSTALHPRRCEPRGRGTGRGGLGEEGAVARAVERAPRPRGSLHPRGCEGGGHWERREPLKEPSNVLLDLEEHGFEPHLPLLFPFFRLSCRAVGLSGCRATESEASYRATELLSLRAADLPAPLLFFVSPTPATPLSPSWSLFRLLEARGNAQRLPALRLFSLRPPALRLPTIVPIPPGSAREREPRRARLCPRAGGHPLPRRQGANSRARPSRRKFEKTEGKNMSFEMYLFVLGSARALPFPPDRPSSPSPNPASSSPPRRRVPGRRAGGGGARRHGFVRRVLGARRGARPGPRPVPPPPRPRRPGPWRVRVRGRALVQFLRLLVIDGQVHGGLG